jgi:hypothetical protein
MPGPWGKSITSPVSQAITCHALDFPFLAIFACMPPCDGSCGFLLGFAASDFLPAAQSSALYGKVFWLILLPCRNR